MRPLAHYAYASIIFGALLALASCATAPKSTAEAFAQAEIAYGIALDKATLWQNQCKATPDNCPFPRAKQLEAAELFEEYAAARNLALQAESLGREVDFSTHTQAMYTALTALRKILLIQLQESRIVIIKTEGV